MFVTARKLIVRIRQPPKLIERGLELCNQMLAHPAFEKNQQIHVSKKGPRTNIHDKQKM